MITLEELGCNKEESKTHQLDSFELNGVRLTLVNYQTGYGFSPEIGYRRGEDFNLIQWSTLSISKNKAWDIAKRMVIKNKTAKQIIKLFERLER